MITEVEILVLVDVALLIAELDTTYVVPVATEVVDTLVPSLYTSVVPLVNSTHATV